MDVLENTMSIPQEGIPPLEEESKSLGFGSDKYDEILNKIEDPNCSVADVSRMLAIEIAKATRDMASEIDDPSMGWKSKSRMDHIKALRELSKQLSETEVLSKKDVLNLDGPKCIFFLREVTTLFKQALKESGVEISLVENIIKHFRDIFVTNEAKLRKDIENVNSKVVD